MSYRADRAWDLLSFENGRIFVINLPATIDQCEEYYPALHDLAE